VASIKKDAYKRKRVPFFLPHDVHISYVIVARGNWTLLVQNNTFPERGLVYDFTFEKRSSGVWIDWMDTIDSATGQIPANATVGVLSTSLMNCCNMSAAAVYP